MSLRTATLPSVAPRTVADVVADALDTVAAVHVAAAVWGAGMAGAAAKLAAPAGLAAAIRLQAQGHQVTLVDKRDKPGGRAYVYEQDGFVFDGGPTIITAPTSEIARPKQAITTVSIA